MTDQPTSAVEGLGHTAFETFTSLSAVHGDGWGMAWREPGTRATRATASPGSAADDDLYAELATRALGSAGLIHLRWATDGLEVSVANTHPFSDGDYALAHNGSIAPVDKLESVLSGESLARLNGGTDSERYFRFVLQCIYERAGDERAGLAHAVCVLQEHFPDASLNALLLTPTHLYAVHVNSQAETPLEDLRELFESDGAMPHGHVTGYFDMAYRMSSTAVHVISSGLPDEGWVPVPPDSILAIDLMTREIDVLDPAPTEPAR